MKGDLMNRNIVTSVSEYIKVVTDNISDYLKQKKIVVFRGECKDYKETSCVPNIFRQNVLYKNKKFEKNLFDEMCQYRQILYHFGHFSCYKSIIYSTRRAP